MNQPQEPQKKGQPKPEDAPTIEEPVGESEASQTQEDWKAKHDELLTRMKYLAAEFDNYKKHVEGQRKQWAVAGEMKLAAGLLPSLDELAAALEQMRKAGTSDDALHGLRMVEKNLHRVLRAHGLKQVDALGKPFDAATMEAAGFEECGEEEDGKVVRELRPGFLFHGHLLRAASVKVGKARHEGNKEAAKTDDANAGRERTDDKGEQT